MKKKSKLKINHKGKAYSLFDSPLYKLQSKRRLANILQESLLELRTLCRGDGLYKEFEEKSKPGKSRPIQQPVLRLDKVHTRLASLLSRIASPAYLHSGKKGCSNVTNARAHFGSNNLLSTDIKAFFPSTTRKMVFLFFSRTMKCSPDVADMLADLCTYRGRVPTGSRISMPIAFWANFSMFEELARLAHKHEAIMTVYVDDLTFSGKNVNKHFRAITRKIISRRGHTMHIDKTRLYRAEQPKLVTGVVIVGSELKVRREQHRQLGSEMDQWNAIKDSPDASVASVTQSMIGRLYSMGVVESRFKDKAMTAKRSMRI